MFNNDSRMSRELDHHITGNYGEDQFKNERQGKFIIVPQPYYRKTGNGGIKLDAWKCHKCPVVRLSVRAIEHHCFVEHGIFRRKYLNA